MNSKIPSCTLTNALSWESRWFYPKPFLISYARQSAHGPLVHSNFQTSIWKIFIYFLFQIYISQQSSREDFLHLTMFYGPGLACLTRCVVSAMPFSCIIAASGPTWSQMVLFRKCKSSLTFARNYPICTLNNFSNDYQLAPCICCVKWKVASVFKAIMKMSMKTVY